MIVPRVVFAGLSGGGGKTLVSVGVAAAWQGAGRVVAPFKKGPDYIDAAWLSRAASQPCRNLDLFLMSREVVEAAFASSAQAADVAVVEGNRGLFDGVDEKGSFSTAELAKLIKAPVILVVDGTKATRTLAAMVLGCQRLDPRLQILGVVLNRMGSRRHEAVVRAALADICGIPVLGALPRLPHPPFPERHLGLVTPEEHHALRRAVDRARELAETHLDLRALWQEARRASTLEAPAWTADLDRQARRHVRIGVCRDEAFCFYYPDNLEALERAGAELVTMSPLRDGGLPPLDGLYLGGGFPETLAGALEANASFRRSVREAAEDGLPIYAECGGAVYLGQELIFEGRRYAMAGALPAGFAFADRPRGHGYTVLEATSSNPFYPSGTEVRGHEFHHTHLDWLMPEAASFAFQVRRGHGFGDGRDGLVHRNMLACYTHVHALGTPEWAIGLVRAAGARRRQRAELAGAVS